ncbi:Uncharacterised protein [Vibrio cholerae]|nr:Uncharacterised protein [Vibrio cholerae]CSI17229.1 Uncharacterised protein [Vibrio cholerae]
MSKMGLSPWYSSNLAVSSGTYSEVNSLRFSNSCRESMRILVSSVPTKSRKMRCARPSSPYSIERFLYLLRRSITFDHKRLRNAAS